MTSSTKHSNYNDTVVWYFNITEFSATPGTLVVSEEGLAFTGDNNKTLQLSVSDIKSAKFSYHVKNRRQQVLSGSVEHVANYKLVIKTKYKQTYRIHIQDPKTRQVLVDLFQVNGIPVKGSDKNEDLQAVDRHNTTIAITLLALGMVAVIIMVTMAARANLSSGL